MMLEFYEYIAKRIEKYSGFLFALALAIFFARFAFLDQMNINLLLASKVAIHWGLGLSLVSWFYGSEIIIKEYGERERVGKMRRESAGVVLFANLFFSVWFFSILILSIYVVYRFVAYS
jgi:hypothetical protein